MAVAQFWHASIGLAPADLAEVFADRAAVVFSEVADGLSVFRARSYGLRYPDRECAADRGRRCRQRVPGGLTWRGVLGHRRDAVGVAGDLIVAVGVAGRDLGASTSVLDARHPERRVGA